mgnify:CR=1 FL=1
MRWPGRCRYLAISVFPRKDPVVTVNLTSMRMQVVRIRHMRMHVPQGCMLMYMAVLS